MSTDDNKALLRRAYLDGFNNRDMSIVDEVFAPDYVGHFPGQPPSHGIEPLKSVLGAFFSAFPDIVFAIEDLLAEGDKVVLRWSAQGTHLGTWRGFPPSGEGIPATGRTVTFHATDIYRIAGGKVVEEWNTLEQVDVLEQIEDIPLPN